MDRRSASTEVGRITTHQDPKGEFLSVAWRGNSLIAVAFYEARTDSATGDFAAFVPWEVRVFAVPDDYPNAMPAEELAERTSRWMRYDRNHLAGGGNPLQERETRSVPFERMWQELNRVYWSDGASDDFTAPTVDEAAAALTSGERCGYRNSRDFRAAVTQLQAVEVYVQAVAAGDDSPIRHVAKALGADDTRARNVIQSAREAGFLTRTRQGRSGGLPTRAAVDLSVQVKAIAKAPRKAEK